MEAELEIDCVFGHKIRLHVTNDGDSNDFVEFCFPYSTSYFSLNKKQAIEMIKVLLDAIGEL